MRTRAILLSVLRSLLLVLTGGLGLAQEGADARSRFRDMSPRQREEFTRNLERWRDMSDAERARMRERFERLRDWERRVPDALPPEEADQLRRMRDGERNNELRSKTRDWLRQRSDHIPPEERSEYRERLEKMSPEERARHFHAMVDREIHRRIERHVDAWVADQKLTQEEAVDLRGMVEQRGPERFQKLREWMLKRPDLFDLPPQAVELLRNADDPAEAGRMLSRMGCHGGRRRDRSEWGERLENYLREHGVHEETIRQIRETRNDSERRKLLRELESTIPWPPPFFEADRSPQTDGERGRRDGHRNDKDPPRRPDGESRRETDGTEQDGE